MKIPIYNLTLLAAIVFTWPLGYSLASEIGATGGQAELKSSNLGRVHIRVTPGTFASKSEVELRVTQSRETAEAFDATLLTRPGRLKKLPGEIRIQAGKIRPKSNVKLQIQLPESLVLANGTLRVMAQFFYESDMELHDSFDEIDSTFNLTTRNLQFELEPRYFSSARGKIGKMEAIVVIVVDSEK